MYRESSMNIYIFVHYADFFLEQVKVTSHVWFIYFAN